MMQKEQYQYQRSRRFMEGLPDQRAGHQQRQQE